MGRTVNLKEINKRKQLLSMENRRICTEKDRIFNERLKMAEALNTTSVFPKVKVPKDRKPTVTSHSTKRASKIRRNKIVDTETDEVTSPTSM